MGFILTGVSAPFWVPAAGNVTVGRCSQSMKKLMDTKGHERRGRFGGSMRKSLFFKIRHTRPNEGLREATVLECGPLATPCPSRVWLHMAETWGRRHETLMRDVWVSVSLFCALASFPGASALSALHRSSDTFTWVFDLAEFCLCVLNMFWSACQNYIHKVTSSWIE